MDHLIVFSQIIRLVTLEFVLDCLNVLCCQVMPYCGINAPAAITLLPTGDRIIAARRCL